MKGLAKFLTNNPVVVVVVFLVSIMSGIATLLLGVKDIYSGYLSKSIEMPAWLILLIIIVISIVWAVYGSRTKVRRVRPHELVADEKFGVERVKTGGRRFVACTFDGSELVIDGEAFDFERCVFKQPRFSFDGASAQTIGMLAAMYRDPPFRPLIENVFSRIRSNNLGDGE